MAKSVEQIYEEAAQAYENTVAVPQASPDAGEYVFVYEDLAEVPVRGGKGEEGTRVVLIGRCLAEGDFQGRRAVIGDAVMGIPARAFTMANLKGATELILGKSSGNPKEDVAALKTAFGTGVKVRFWTNTNASGQTFTRQAIVDLVDLNVLDGIDAEPVPADDPSPPTENFDEAVDAEVPA